MRRFFVILFLLIGFPVHSWEDIKPRHEFFLQGEFRNDTIDYDDIEKMFVRDKIRLSYNTSSLSFTHMYIMSGEHRFTWNIIIRALSPRFESTIGNYYINAGAGLLLGKKSALSPDPFNRRTIISRNNLIIPCSTGNPQFCFQGIAASMSFPITSAVFSMTGFCSFRNRYVKNDSYESGSIISSFQSVIASSKKNYRISEPVAVNDYGGMLVLNVADRILIQTYVIYSNIRRSNSRMLLWNYNEAEIIPQGDKAFFAWGLYAQYADDYITLFCECGVPSRIVSSFGKKQQPQRDIGLLFGLKFRHPVFSISFTGKTTGRNFYSPYSAGNYYAERILAADISVRPVRRLTLGSSFFSEKKISPSHNQHTLSSNRRERVYLLYALPDKGAFTASFTCLETEKQYGKDRFLQFRSSLRYYIHASILLTFSGKAQKKGTNGYAGSINSGVSFSFMNCMTMTVNYGRIFASKNNEIYSVVAPQRDSITPGKMVDRSCNLITCKLSFRYRWSIFSARYQYQFNGNTSMLHRFEISAMLRF